MGTELGDDWAIEDPNEEWYNPTKGPKGTWMPEGKVILELLERIQKEKVFELKWKCPGRRPPPSSQPEEEMETEADFDEEEMEEEKEEDKSTAFGEFDFDDAPSEDSAKITPRRTPGSTKASRPQKRVACMDNVLNKILTQRKQHEAARANKGVRGRRTPIYSTGSPRSRLGLSPSHAGSNLFKSTPPARPFPTAKSPVSSVPKPTPTVAPLSVPTSMEVEQGSNQKVGSVTQPKEHPQTTSVMSNTYTSTPSRPVSSSASTPVTSVPTSASSPSVKAMLGQSTSYTPVTTTTTPSRPTVPPLRLSVSSALQSQIQAAVTSASQNAQKEYREPIPKLLLKIPPPSANQPATSMLLPPGYSRSSPGNKSKSSPGGSQNRKSPNQLGVASQQGSPVLKHASKTPPLYQNPPKTPPGYSSGHKTPPLHQNPPKTPPGYSSDRKTPPLYQNPPKTPPGYSSGHKTPPLYQNPPKTPPGYSSGHKTPPLYQNPPKTPPGYSSGHKTPPLQHSGNKSPAFNQSASKTPPLYQSTPLTPPPVSSGSKTPPAFQNRSKTPPGGVRSQSPQMYQSGSKTPPIYPPRGSTFSSHNFPLSESVRSPPQGHRLHPTSPVRHGNPVQTFSRPPFPPRTLPSPVGSPRGHQTSHSPSRITPPSPLAHTNHPRSPFYPNFPPLPMDQAQSRPPFHQSPQPRQPRSKTPPAYHSVVSRAQPPFPPPPPGGISSGPNTPMNRVPVQAPVKVLEQSMGAQTSATRQNPMFASNPTNPIQQGQSTAPQFRKRSPSANELQTPANLFRPQFSLGQQVAPSMLPPQATTQQHLRVAQIEHSVISQPKPTVTESQVFKSTPMHHANAQSRLQQPSAQHVVAPLPQPSSQEQSTGQVQDQTPVSQQTAMPVTGSKPTSQHINHPVTNQQVVPPQRVNQQ